MLGRMTRRTFLAASTTAIYGAAAADLKSPNPASSGFSAEGLAKIPLLLQKTVDSGELPGVVSLIWHKGELVQANAVGMRDIENRLPMERTTIVRIASMSKPITVVTALTLLDEGKLALGDPITKWAPEFANMHVLRQPDGPLDDTYPASRDITIEDLMTHRSGLSYGATASGPLAKALMQTAGTGIDSPLTPDEWMKGLGKLPLAYAPGERFNYGHSIDVLGLIIGRVARSSFRQVVLERVCDPLKMVDTDFWIPPDKRNRAATFYVALNKRVMPISLPVFVGSAPKEFVSGGQGLVSTADDYLTFARMLMRGGEVNGVRLLKSATVKLMTSNRLTTEQRQIPFFGTSYWDTQGFGLGVSMIMDSKGYAARGAGSEGAFTWGGAFGGCWQADPAQDLVMIWLPQVVSGQMPTPGSMPVVPGIASYIEFQKLSYAALNN